jgi:N-acyl-D-amino-acid deacylase
MAFDLVVRNGTLVDGTGAPGRPADVGIGGDRITAVGDLAAVGDGDVAHVIEARGHVVVFDPLTVRDGTETGERPRRLLRRGA